MAVRKAFRIDLSVESGRFIEISQVILSGKPYIQVGSLYLTNEEWNALCTLQALMVTPHVSVPQPKPEKE